MKKIIILFFLLFLYVTDVSANRVDVGGGGGGSTNLTTSNSWTIGDGTSGDVTLTFDGDAGTDGTLTYDVSEDAFVFANVVKFLADAAPTVDTAGDAAFDTNFWDTGRGALLLYDGTAGTALLGIQTSDACNANEVPKFQAGGTWTCETDSTGTGLGTNLSSSTTDILSNTGAIVLGGTGNVNNEKLSWDYETTANEVSVTTTTGITVLDFSAFTIKGAAFEATASTAPAIKFYDSDGIDVDINGQIDGNLTDTGSGTEDFDIFIKQQIAGVLTTSATFDADGNVTIARLETDATGETNLEARLDIGGEVTSTGMSSTVIGDSISVSNWNLTTPTFTTTIIYANAAADATLSSAGMSALNTTDEQLSFHSAADGEISGEAALSLIRHFSRSFDPAAWYDQESVFRTVPLFTVGDDSPEGITITEWEVDYAGGNPTTELDADLMCDTTPDYNPAAGATVMDVLDTTTGSSGADTGFDSATCANASKVYIRFGADPTDANVIIAVDIWFYNLES